MRKKFISANASFAKGIHQKRNAASIGVSTFGCLVLGVLMLLGCSYTDMGQRVNLERGGVEKLENKRHQYETQLVIVMNNLELHPEDQKLIVERDKVKKRLLDLEGEIFERRKMLNQILVDWDQKIIQDRIQGGMVDKEVRDNAYKEEGEWYESPEKP